MKVKIYHIWPYKKKLLLELKDDLLPICKSEFGIDAIEVCDEPIPLEILLQNPKEEIKTLIEEMERRKEGDEISLAVTWDLKLPCDYGATAGLTKESRIGIVFGGLVLEKSGEGVKDTDYSIALYNRSGHELGHAHGLSHCQNKVDGTYCLMNISGADHSGYRSFCDSCKGKLKGVKDG